ncbi:hypothetical protein PRIPAC_82811 [Pristionchus pacificus]|uniref:FAD-binding PCMH-type domain-containing protein n=1 Tax=Pristionchus pacificus TaxID=54126 RepID=A0A2A6CQ10_PRIPA|nr:hypothetical protein PRIPAC_82811 [Pristionchus pacificus]|eukprot:PDM80133.1 hypothetical protein PRIPAC_32712 [Pristionchus pacificus]
MVNSTITFFVNGNEEGACGACTVVIARWNKQEQRARFVSANACITPLYLVGGALVLTVEGIGSQKRLHPIQERLASGNATQCGFCSPGFVMAAYALLRNNPCPTAEEIRSALVGNLCRCTGYRPILEALESFSKSSGGCCMGGKGGCPCKEAKGEGSKEKTPEIVCGLVNFEQLQPFDETSEIIFPLKLIMDNKQEPLIIHGKRVTLHSPTSLEKLSAIFKSLPHVDKFVSTGIMTRLIQSMNPSPTAKSNWLSVQRIEQLKVVDVDDCEIHIGSGLSIRQVYNINAEFLEAVRAHCKTEQYVTAINTLYAKYSSDQVKNTASWSGALASASPTSDFCTIFMALNWRVRLLNLSTSAYRTLSADQFFTSADGNKTALEADEIITVLLVPVAPKDRIAVFKHGKRFGADDAVLNAAAGYDEGESCGCGAVATSAIVAFFRIVVGAFRKPLLLEYSSEKAKTVIGKLRKGESADDLISSSITEDFKNFAGEKEFDYKTSIAKAALTDMLSVLAGSASGDGLSVSTANLEPLQLFKDADLSIAPVGRPLRHAAADRHTTGEAQYVDDVKIHELKHAALVLSTEAHARIVSIDATPALTLAGVLAYVDARDIPPGGLLRPSIQPYFTLQDDTPVFADGVVEMVGQPIGCIVAEDVQTARRAAKLVKVEYEKLPAILTIEDAIAAKSYLSEEHAIYGKKPEEIDEALKAAPILLEGECSIGGQEHLYMETQSSIVVPQENDEWIVYTSTQSPNNAQYLCASILGIPANNVVIKVKRLGGAFGGKLTGDGVARGPAVVAANKLRKPVSCVLHRYDDMAATGKRHPAIFKWRVGIDEKGRLLALHVTQYLQGGYSIDHSLWIATVIEESSAVFRIPSIRAECYAMKTNTCSNTAFRAYGMPQQFFFMETVMAAVAKRVGRQLNDVKKLNLFQEGDVVLGGTTVRNYCLPECWKQVEQLSDFAKLQKECEEFNKTSHRIKRGVAISGAIQGLTHPGVGEQGTALVQLMLDGTVRVNVGAVEMGQGLNTKMIQIASGVLKVPHEKITIIEMATDKTANTVPSAGSKCTDICGHAVKKACEKLAEGIQPHIEKCNGDYVKALMSAWLAKVPLQICETAIIPRKGTGVPDDELAYFTSGAACVQVEVDCLTGEHKLKAVDIVMDVGDSINPAVDIGQIEGAFMQGYGLTTSEEIDTNDQGKITNASVYAYKVPTVHMVPERFRVKLLEHGKNYPGQIYRSKGIGESPYLLATAVHNALRMAIDSFRGKDDFQRLDSPLTAKRILKACQGGN